MSSNEPLPRAPRTLHDRASELVERAKRVLEAATTEPDEAAAIDHELLVARAIAEARERGRDEGLRSARKIIAEAETRAEAITAGATRQAAATIHAARATGQRILEEARNEASAIEARQRGGLSFSSLWIEAGDQPDQATAEDFFANADNESVDIFRR